MTNPASMRSVAFLDTMILHFMGIYLDFASQHGLYPLDGALRNAKAAKVAAKQRVNKTEEKSLKEGLVKGLEVVYFLATRDLQVEYSPVSELELLEGRTRGRAMLSAATEGVPDRFGSRLPDDEIGKRVSGDDLSDIKGKIDRLPGTLETSSIVVSKATGIARTNDALELAKGINGLVYLGAMDTVIYASALVAKADYLITNDDYLKETVRKIYDPPQGSCYQKIQRQLKKLVSDLILGKPDDVRLPSAHKITGKGTLRPSLPVSGSTPSP